MRTPDCLPPGEWKLLSYNPDLGEYTWFMDDGINTHTAVTFDPDELFEKNNQAQTDNLNRKWGDMQRFASMPPHLWFKHLSEPTLQDDKKYISRFFNDIDNRKFRTKLGTV